MRNSRSWRETTTAMQPRRLRQKSAASGKMGLLTRGRSVRCWNGWKMWGRINGAVAQKRINRWSFSISVRMIQLSAVWKRYYAILKGMNTKVSAYRIRCRQIMQRVGYLFGSLQGTRAAFRTGLGHWQAQWMLILWFGI